MLFHPFFFVWLDFVKSVEGTGLVFIVFTQAIVELPAAPFWAIIFFLMLLALGVGSQIGTLEGVISTVFDIQIIRGARKEVVSGKTLLTFLKKLKISAIFYTLNYLMTFHSRGVYYQLPDWPSFRDWGR